MATEPLASTQAHRHAVYAAPHPDSPWWRMGSQWLGRCAATGAPLPQPRLPGFTPDELARLTQAPRRYGWHATLKAPFQLADGVTAEGFERGLRTLAASRPALTLAPLVVRRLGDFLALVVDGDTQPVVDLAAACVTQLHPLAAPLPPTELARRRNGGLTERQDALLRQWGYPHVMEQFRFHFSLTGTLAALSPRQVDALAQAATAWFAPLPPLQLDQLAWFAEPAPGADFVWVKALPLQGSAGEGA